MYLAQRPYVTCCLPAYSRDGGPGTPRHVRYRYAVRAVSTCFLRLICASALALRGRLGIHTQDQDPPINPEIRLRLALPCCREKRLPDAPLPSLLGNQRMRGHEWFKL